MRGVVSDGGVQPQIAASGNQAPSSAVACRRQRRSSANPYSPSMVLFAGITAVAPTPTLVVRDWTTWTPVVTVTAALNPRTMVLVTVTDWLRRTSSLTVRGSLAVDCQNLGRSGFGEPAVRHVKCRGSRTDDEEGPFECLIGDLNPFDRPEVGTRHRREARQLDGTCSCPRAGAGDEHRARRGHGEERGKDAQPGALPSSTSRPTRRDLCWFHSDSSSLGFAARHASTIGKSLDARPHLPVRNGSAVLTSRRRTSGTFRKTYSSSSGVLRCFPQPASILFRQRLGMPRSDSMNHSRTHPQPGFEPR